ncbi:MAG: phosphoribosylanthranilate isomerase [Desulfococcaceae bacterium]|jgi:phosphoribosylanthranilate isomerase|nr:phosphoribosylanthranilate isomerase [Desulfococcaceae bacterium]
MSESYKAKICGTTNAEDAALAAAEGADFFGAVIETDFSPRSLSIADAKALFDRPPIPGVALVFRMKEQRIETLIRELRPFAVQFLDLADIPFLKHLDQNYPDMELWQSVHLPPEGEAADIRHFRKTVADYTDAGVDALIFDTVAVMQGKTKFGGTGQTSDWNLVKKLMDAVQSPVPLWLAGGIRPENVGEALENLDPYGIDLCSGVEAVPGKKDPAKVKALMTVIKEKSRSRRNK